MEFMNLKVVIEVGISDLLFNICFPIVLRIRLLCRRSRSQYTPSLKSRNGFEGNDEDEDEHKEYPQCKVLLMYSFCLPSPDLELCDIYSVFLCIL